MVDLLISFCGWIGTISYAVYVVPQAVDAFQKGKTEGLSSGMVLLLFCGSLCSLIYILPEIASPLFYNFLASFSATTVVARYHFWPRKNKEI